MLADTEWYKNNYDLYQNKDSDIMNNYKKEILIYTTNIYLSTLPKKIHMIKNIVDLTKKHNYMFMLVINNKYILSQLFKYVKLFEDDIDSKYLLKLIKKLRKEYTNSVYFIRNSSIDFIKEINKIIIKKKYKPELINYFKHYDVNYRPSIYECETKLYILNYLSTDNLHNYINGIIKLLLQIYNCNKIFIKYHNRINSNKIIF